MHKFICLLVLFPIVAFAGQPVNKAKLKSSEKIISHPEEEGHFGKETIEGIEVWRRSEPIRKYKVIGTVMDDSTSRGGLSDLIASGSMTMRLVEEAKKRKADGYYHLENSKQMTGIVGFHGTTSLQRRVAFFVYVK